MKNKLNKLCFMLIVLGLSLCIISCDKEGNIVVDNIINDNLPDITTYMVVSTSQTSFYGNSSVIAEPISGEAFYYNINYRTYENETVITSFTKEDLRSYSSEIKLVQECIVNYDCRNADSLEFQRMEDRVVAPNQSVEIVISGSKAIRQILLKAEAKDINQALRSTVLEMEFDGHRTVWCPIGDFYGSGYKISPYQTRYTKVDKDGTMSCLWIMPFADTGIVRIKNYGIQDVSVDKFQIEYSGYTWNDRSMYFGAGWREDNRIATRKGGKNVGHEETDRFDVNYVELTGRGVLVGNGVTLFNTTDAWWGEGDEKIFIDGEKFPSHFGTGSEDFYGYAWSNPNNFDHPFIAQPDGRGAMQPGYVVNLRYRSLDAIPFSNSLKFDMEIWHQAGTVLNHAPVSYWYMFPSGKSNLLPVPEQAREAVALSRLDFYLDGYEERNIFIEKTLVKIEGRENGFEIRYTLDGTDPSSGSSLYEGPFQLDKSTTVKSKGYSPKGYATEILEGKFIKQKPLKGKALNSPDEGLKYQYFELNDVLNSTAELSTQSADKTGIVKSMTYPDVDLPLKFGLILTGYLHVKKTGVYSFSTITNDGSMLYVHDQLVVSNDGPHGARERSGQIALAPGYHPVRLEYIQIGGSRHLEAFIEGPGISKREILSSELAYY